MAYSSITNPGDYFNTVLYTGNGGTQSITGVGFQPDYVWLKERASDAVDHKNVDSVRGATKKLESNTNELEGTATTTVTSFDSDGFSLGSSGATNGSSDTYVSWNWLAGGTAPAITYVVKVVSDSGNKYRFDDFGTSAVTLELQEGGTYTFDQSDSSNSGHPLRFYTAADKTGGEYTTGVTTTGTPGSSGAQTVITVAASAPTLYYQCSSHAGMGGQANTNSTHGSSNFSGSIQSTVSVNTTAGFSVTSYTGTGSASTVGHGLSSTPELMIFKNRDRSANWVIYHHKLSATPQTSYIYFSTMGGRHSYTGFFNSTAPTSSVFSIGTDGDFNSSGEKMIGYCFNSVKGYSKFGSYTGNGNADGPFEHTGFKPAFIIIKQIGSDGENWWVYDNTRNTTNLVTKGLYPNANNAEVDYSGSSQMNLDFVSNGFKLRASDGALNGSGSSYIYIAFAENPFVTSGTKAAGTAR